MIDIDALIDTAIRTSVVSTCKKGLFSMDITSMEFYFTFFFSRNTYRWFSLCGPFMSSLVLFMLGLPLFFCVEEMK